jgi:protein-L-isoaspartate(D-aspartate) O-methyltransferase
MTNSEFERRRENLIKDLVNKHFINDVKIAAAFRAVPMEQFLPHEVRHYSYFDQPLPYHYNRPMAAPHINAIFLQLLKLEPGVSYEILQLSSMSGYFAALISEVTNRSHIRIIEDTPEIVEVTKQNLAKSGHDKTIEVIRMDPIEAFWEFPHSNRIIFCGAVSTSIINEISKEMPNDSILIAPVFSNIVLFMDQDMIRVTKSESGQITTESFGKVSFIIMQSESYQKWASKTQELLFNQIQNSLEEYFTTTLPREEPLLTLNLPEHIMDDFIEANTLFKKDFKKSAILLAVLTVKESLQYALKENIDLTQLSELETRVAGLLNEAQLRDFETLLDIERSVINFDYKHPPNMDRLAKMALDVASNLLESLFRTTKSKNQ